MNQACSVKMPGYWHCSFLWVFMDLGGNSADAMLCWRYNLRWLASFYYLLYFLINWLTQTVLYFLTLTVCLYFKGKFHLKLSKLILNFDSFKNWGVIIAMLTNFGLTTTYIIILKISTLSHIKMANKNHFHRFFSLNIYLHTKAMWTEV